MLEGPAFMVKHRFMRNFDFDKAGEQVEKALADYDMNGRIEA